MSSHHEQLAFDGDVKAIPVVKALRGGEVSFEERRRQLTSERLGISVESLEYVENIGWRVAAETINITPLATSAEQTPVN